MALPREHKAQQPHSSCAAALLRASEVADLIGSTEAQVRNMRARAQLPPPVKVPGLGVRWLRTDLERWLAQLGEPRRSSTG
jgi:predicted DNA-binding transcriptional regulator AlpA